MRNLQPGALWPGFFVALIFFEKILREYLTSIIKRIIFVLSITHKTIRTMKNAIFEENEAIYTTKEVLKKKQCPCFVEYEDWKRNNVKIKQCKYSYDLIYFEQGEKDARLFARYGSKHYKVCIDILKKILQEQSSLMYTHF